MKYQTDLEASGCQEFLRKVFSAFAWNLFQTTDLSLSLLPSPLFFCVIMRIINCRLHFPNAVCTKHQSSSTTQYITVHQHFEFWIIYLSFCVYLDIPCLGLGLSNDYIRRPSETWRTQRGSRRDAPVVKGGSIVAHQSLGNHWIHWARAQLLSSHQKFNWKSRVTLLHDLFGGQKT